MFDNLLISLLLSQGRPFHFTFFVSNDIKLHQTDSARADEIISRHIGKLMYPPATPERLAEFGPFESREFEVSKLLCFFLMIGLLNYLFVLIAKRRRMAKVF